MKKWNKFLRTIFGLEITLFFTFSKERKKMIYELLIKSSVEKGDYYKLEECLKKYNYKLSQKEKGDLFENFVFNNIDYSCFTTGLKKVFPVFNISKNVLNLQLEKTLKNSAYEAAGFLYKNGAKNIKINSIDFLKNKSKYDLKKLSFLIENHETMDVVITSLLKNEPNYLLDNLLPILKEKSNYLSQKSIDKLFFYFYKHYFDKKNKLEKFNIKPSKERIDSMVMYFITSKEVKKILHSIYLGASKKVISEAITFLSLKGQRSALHQLEVYLVSNSMEISITDLDKQRCLEAI